MSGHADGWRRDRRATTGAVAAACVLAVMSTLRVLFPGAYGLADRSGNETAAGVVLAVFTVTLLTPLVVRVLGPARALVALAVVFAAWRIAVQLVGSVPFWLAGVGAVVALAFAALALTTTTIAAAGARAVGVVTGLVLDVAVLGTCETLDPAWATGALGFVLGVLVAAAAVGTGWLHAHQLRSDVLNDDRTRLRLGDGTALGALLALELLFLANPGYVASSGELSMGWAVLVTGLATALAWLGPLGTTVADRHWRLATLLAALVLAAVGLVAPDLSGTVTVAVVALGQIGAGVVLRSVFAAEPVGTHPHRLGTLGVTLGWLVLLLVVLLYQIHVDQPLPFDHRWVTAAAGMLTALAAVGHRVTVAAPAAEPVASGRRLAWAGIGAPLVAVAAVAAALGLTAPAVAVPTTTETLRVAQWNVRQAVDSDGQLVPQEIADTLKAQGPLDAVVLNEVARGWPLSGQVDLAEWLARELSLRLVWIGGADEQFGTAVLTRLPVTATEVTELPVAGSSQGRRLGRQQLLLPDGRELTLLATHLQHRNTPAAIEARDQEVQIVLREWAQAPLTILAGDLNPRQGDPPAYPPRRPESFAEVKPFLDAGFTTAADLTSCEQPTSSRNCSDYVLVTGGLEETSYTVVEVDGIDHRLLVVEVTVPAKG